MCEHARLTAPTHVRAYVYVPRVYKVQDTYIIYNYIKRVHHMAKAGGKYERKLLFLNTKNNKYT